MFSLPELSQTYVFGVILAAVVMAALFFSRPDHRIPDEARQA